MNSHVPNEADARPIRTLPLYAKEPDVISSASNNAVVEPPVSVNDDLAALELRLRADIRATLTTEYEKKWNEKVKELHNQVDAQQKKIQTNFAAQLSLLEAVSRKLEVQIHSAKASIDDTALALVLKLLSGVIGDSEKYSDFLTDYLSRTVDSLKPNDNLCVYISSADFQLLGAGAKENFPRALFEVDHTLRSGDFLISFDSLLYRASIKDHIDRLYASMVACLNSSS